MPLIFIGKYSEKPYFIPDRMENVRHNAADDESMTVYDSSGKPIFGRVIEGSTKQWSCQLHNWLWVPNTDSQNA